MACDYCKTLFYRCMLILRFSYVANSLHFNLADFPVSTFITKIPVVLLFTYYQEYCMSHHGSIDILCM